MNNITNIYEKTLEKYYESDIWDLTKHPNKEIADFHKKKLIKYRTMDFTKITSSNKKLELKKFFIGVFNNKINIYWNTAKFINYYHLIPFANTFPDDSFLDVELDVLKEFFQDYIDKYGATQESIRVLNTLQFHIYQAIDTRDGFARDVWDLTSLSISANRLNKANEIKLFNFLNIKNQTNREYAKIWVRYLLGCTEYSVSTILNYISVLTLFFNEVGNIDASDITSDDITEIIDDLSETYSNDRINHILSAVQKLFLYFETIEDSHIKSPVLKSHFLKNEYIPADNLVSENVILQLFRNMHTLPLQERCMLLINYSAGLRISDICQIKTKNCLYKEEDGSCYIHYFCQKMQKPAMNLIPPSLYEMIEKQQAAVGNSFYLFPAFKDKSSPTRTGYYSSKVNEWVRSCGIKNDDGTPYRYRSHAFRHSLATDLLQTYNVDLQVIQLAVLQHKEIQMSLTYAQRGDDFNKTLHDRYIDNYGSYKPMDFEGIDGINKKALGNGFCGYPSKLGTCPYSDACLHCEFFRTSKQFLDIHKKHLEQVRKNIVLFQTNNWIHNLATAKKTEEILMSIIASLEKID